MEGFTLSVVKLSEVIDHPINHAIYGDRVDPTLVESIREHGILTPIIVVRHSGGSWVCLSGHRRRLAAKEAGLAEVPAFVSEETMPDWQQVQVIIEANRQRAKTGAQIARETEELAEAKKIEAEHRMKLGKKADSDPAVNLPQGQKRAPTAIEQAAKITGAGSRKTAESAVKAAKKMKELEQRGETEKAKQIEHALDHKSFRAAAELADKIDEEQKPKKDKPEEKAAPVVVDDFSKPVPESLHPAFANRKATLALLRELTKLRKAVEERGQQPGGDLLPMFDIGEKFKDLRIALKMNIPYTECFRCQRNVQKGCKLCQGRGWISEGEYNRNKTEGGTRWLENR
jgi:ParB-like chromosome segregation protein Spo0J